MGLMGCLVLRVFPRLSAAGCACPEGTARLVILLVKPAPLESMAIQQALAALIAAESAQWASMLTRLEGLRAIIAMRGGETFESGDIRAPVHVH